jgi:predicted kinase
MSKLLVIMRGMTGSGKSTLAKERYPNAKVCSADHWFEKTGKRWNFRDANKAHDLCWEEFNDGLDAHAPVVIVDNNNEKAREYMPYVRDAVAEGYSVLFIHVCCHPITAAQRSKHREALRAQGEVILWKKFRKFQQWRDIHEHAVQSEYVWTSPRPDPGEAEEGQLGADFEDRMVY